MPSAADPAAPPHEPERVRTPEDQRLRLVIYIDNFNLRPFNRNRVMRELRAFIGQKLGKDDQLMLVTYDRELHIRRTFTSDPGLIAAAMLDLEKISAQGVHADSERRDVLQRIDDAQSVAEAEGHARTYAQSTYNDLQLEMRAEYFDKVVPTYFTIVSGMAKEPAVVKSATSAAPAPLPTVTQVAVKPDAPAPALANNCTQPISALAADVVTPAKSSLSPLERHVTEPITAG